MEIETVLPSQISMASPMPFSVPMQNKSASVPVVQKPSQIAVKPQISAPSYFHSLEENSAPPFVKPVKEPVPHILTGTILNEDEVIAMIAAADADENGLKYFLGEILVEKNIIRNHDLIEKKFLISLLTEVIDYAAQRDFSASKLALLLTIYLDTHLYFKWYYWQTPINVWNYFQEIMIRHTIEDSPTGEEKFEPNESYDIITHFHTIYLSNLPLIHVLTFGVYKLKFTWPYKSNK